MPTSFAELPTITGGEDEDRAVFARARRIAADTLQGCMSGGQVYNAADEIDNDILGRAMLHIIAELREGAL